MRTGDASFDTENRCRRADAVIPARFSLIFLAGKPITTKAIANLLAPFNIAPSEMRIGQQVLRGYHRDQFEDAFARYVSKGSS
jgi:hypothetical protein